ncbi:MAG: tetratricopeptide repeat protein [Desulfotignum sp.]|nr:tetratricopeptide repeat protein [Desulfotignum sp.]
MVFQKHKFIGLSLFLICFFSMHAFAESGNQKSLLQDEITQNEIGMKYFKHGYYKLLPKGHKAEANQNLDLAEKAFKNSIQINKNYIEAHRNLARLYYLRKQFEQAATEYASVIELVPDDIDIYVSMAVVQTELGNFNEAVMYLEKAKTQTKNEQVIQKLDELIIKAKQAE